MAELLLSCVCSAGQTIIRRLEAAKECAHEGKELAARVSSTLDRLQQAVPAFENDGSLRKSLVELKILFEDINDLLSLSLPRPQKSSSLQQHANRVFFSEDHLKAVKDYSNKLDRFLLDLNGAMQLVAKQQQNRMEEQNHRMVDALLAMRITLQDTEDPTVKLYKRQLRGNLIENELVEFEESLGSGSFGKVVSGEYYGKPVAVKRALKEVLNAQERESFRREASTHFALRHDRIVQVVAFRAGDGPHPPCLVMERMDCTLHDYLGITSARQNLSGSLAYVIDICEGMKYLHQSGVLHRDIKSSNILLHNGGAKVSDFGLAHVCSTIGRSTGNGGVLDQKAGTKFWMPPEAHCYDLGAYSYDSDIFSLHVLMWEIVEHRQGGRKHEPEIGRLLVSDRNAKLPLTGGGASDSSMSRLHNLIRACGSRERRRRPKISDVLAEAKDIYDSLSAPGDGARPKTPGVSFQPSREVGKCRLRPSAARRRTQMNKASENRKCSWEAWRDANVGVAVDTAAGEGRRDGAGALQPQPPSPASASAAADRMSENEVPTPTGRDADGIGDGSALEEKSEDNQPKVGQTSGDGTADETKAIDIWRRRLGEAKSSSSLLLDPAYFPDPSHIKHHPTGFWIKISAMLNVVAGAAYIWWRAARSMPEDPASPVWIWLFFAGECIVLVGVWISHLSRSFPAIRDVCTMDDLVEIDSNVASEADVCIMIPTAGEKIEVLKNVLLGAFSQRLWPSPVPTSRQLRVAVLDEKRRREVCDLVQLVYDLAQVLVNPTVQFELCTMLDKPVITPTIFMDAFNQEMSIIVTWLQYSSTRRINTRQTAAPDRVVFTPATHPAFDLATRLANGQFSVTTARVTEVWEWQPGKAKMRTKGWLTPGYRKLFDSSPRIPSIIYSTRQYAGTPRVSPKAGNMNDAIFRDISSLEPVIGNGARIVVVNHARHRLRTEFLQRTVPYFFKLDRPSGNKYKWSDVGFVQTPHRFDDFEDGDPLGNHAVFTHFVSNVSKDGVGGVISTGQGSLWRVDALRGMAADGRQTVDSPPDLTAKGHGFGFRSEVARGDKHTSLEFFKLQWRSAYVCEAGETLSVCVHQPDTFKWKARQVLRRHKESGQLLLKGGVGFVCTSRMPTPFHKIFALEPLTSFIQAVGGFFIIIMPIMFSIFHEAPFDAGDLQFVYFFFPYMITAAIPTILALGWKNLKPASLLTEGHFWLSTSYIQIWGYALGVYYHIICSDPYYIYFHRSPMWPLGLIFFLLATSAIYTIIYWAFYLESDQDGIRTFVASFVACLIAMYSIWPMVRLGWLERWGFS